MRLIDCSKENLNSLSFEEIKGFFPEYEPSGIYSDIKEVSLNVVLSGDAEQIRKRFNNNFIYDTGISYAEIEEYDNRTNREELPRGVTILPGGALSFPYTYNLAVDPEGEKKEELRQNWIQKILDEKSDLEERVSGGHYRLERERVL